VSFAAITLFVASQRVFIAVVYFVIGSVRKLFDTRSYTGSTKVNDVVLNASVKRKKLSLCLTKHTLQKLIHYLFKHHAMKKTYWRAVIRLHTF
jgi:hypothetical protein